MTGKDMGRVKQTVYFCAGGPCTQKGSGLLIRETRALLKTEGLHSTIHTIKTLCTSHCDRGPIIAVQPDNLWYEKMDVEKSERVIREHILENRPVEAWFLDAGAPAVGGAMEGKGTLKSFESRSLPEWGDVRAAVMDPW
jgi:(2Fe-2S) ferredoxin